MQISSKNKRILVFSDPHQDIGKLKKIINHEKADLNISLGDWIDSHCFDEVSDARQTALFLRSWVFDPKNITCLGNHDMPYFFINKYTRCSGYSISKNDMIDQIFDMNKHDIIGKFNWFIWIDDFLCSHAGLHPYHLPPRINIKNKEEVNKWLKSQVEQAKVSLNTGQPHWLFGAGRARGGEQTVGGLTWLDWHQEFNPIEELTQIVGHTNGDKVKTRDFQPYSSNPEKWTNYCIDTNLNQYLIIQDGKLEIKNYSDIL